MGAGQVHYGEVAQNIYDRAKVYVDSMESARVELKGLKANFCGTIGQVIRESVKRGPPEVLLPSAGHQERSITIFQSMGT